MSVVNDATDEEEQYYRTESFLFHYSKEPNFTSAEQAL